MNTTLREALARRIDDASFPGVDVADLIGQGENPASPAAARRRAGQRRRRGRRA